MCNVLLLFWGCLVFASCTWTRLPTATGKKWSLVEWIPLCGGRRLFFGRHRVCIALASLPRRRPPSLKPLGFSVSSLHQGVCYDGAGSQSTIRLGEKSRTRPDPSLTPYYSVVHTHSPSHAGRRTLSIKFTKAFEEKRRKRSGRDGGALCMSSALCVSETIGVWEGGCGCVLQSQCLRGRAMKSHGSFFPHEWDVSITSLSLSLSLCVCVCVCSSCCPKLLNDRGKALMVSMTVKSVRRTQRVKQSQPRRKKQMGGEAAQVVRLMRSRSRY